MADIFVNISPWTENLQSRQIPKFKSTDQFDFFAHRVIYVWNKWLNRIKDDNSVKNFKIKLNDLRNYILKKKFKKAFLGTIEWIT